MLTCWLLTLFSHHLPHSQHSLFTLQWIAFSLSRATCTVLNVTSPTVRSTQSLAAEHTHLTRQFSSTSTCSSTLAYHFFHSHAFLVLFFFSFHLTYFIPQLCHGFHTEVCFIPYIFLIHNSLWISVFHLPQSGHCGHRFSRDGSEFNSQHERPRFHCKCVTWLCNRPR